MAFCKNCGAELAEGARFCRACGTQVTLEAAFAAAVEAAPAEPAPEPAAEPAPEPAPAPVPAYAQPRAEYRPAGAEYPAQENKAQRREQPEKPKKEKKKRIPATMSIGEYIGAIIVMSLPIVGFVFTIIWTCGGCRNQNKANLARAYLILSAIIVVLTVAAIIVMVTVFGFTMAELTDFALL